MYIATGLLVFLFSVLYASLEASAWSLTSEAQQEYPQGPQGSLLASSQEQQHRILLISTPDGKTISGIGSKGSDPGQLLLPMGAQIDAFKRIWVADTLNNRIQIFGIKGDVLQVIGKEGEGPREFRLPNALAIASNGDVFVSDSNNSRVQIFNSSGEYLRAINLAHPGADRATAADVTIDNKRNRLLVLEMVPPKVLVFDILSGHALEEWGTYGLGLGQFLVPMHICVDGQGFAYVSDDQANRITKFGLHGDPLASWGELGADPGTLYHPAGISVVNNELYVLDYGNHRGQVFDLEGHFLRLFAAGKINSDATFPSP